jgi:hypothetical protein
LRDRDIFFSKKKWSATGSAPQRLSITDQPSSVFCRISSLTILPAVGGKRKIAKSRGAALFFRRILVHITAHAASEFRQRAERIGAGCGGIVLIGLQLLAAVFAKQGIGFMPFGQAMGAGRVVGVPFIMVIASSTPTIPVGKAMMP